MKLNVVKCNPAGNMTILVLDPVPAAMRTKIANRLLEEKHLHAEQVGYVETPHDPHNGSLVRLQMMGGEFCANATRSLAAVLAYKGYPGEKAEKSGVIYRMEVSGVQHPVDCRVWLKQDREAVFTVEASLPLPVSLEKIPVMHEGETVYGIWVEMPGISHLVVNMRRTDRSLDFFQQVKEQLAGRITDAFGIMFHDEKSSWIDPLVWVRATDTLYWENGCGSGTAAVGAVLAAGKKGDVRRSISQPGGVLEIAAKWKETVTDISLSGEIELVSEGTVFV